MEELEEMVEQSFLLVQVQKMALLMAQALEPESWVLELEQAKQKELEFVKKEQELPVVKTRKHKNISCFRQARIQQRQLQRIASEQCAHRDR
jgi:hypothetical protein